MAFRLMPLACESHARWGTVLRRAAWRRVTTAGLDLWARSLQGHLSWWSRHGERSRELGAPARRRCVAHRLAD
eukprot:355923-Chlamydomonas_euryale.AAC.1